MIAGLSRRSQPPSWVGRRHEHMRGHRALPGASLSERRRAGFPGSRRPRAREAVRPLPRRGIVQGKPFTHDGARGLQGGRRRPGRGGGQARGEPAPGDDLRRPARDAQERRAAVQARGGPDPRLDRTGRSLAGGPGAQGPPLRRPALVVVRALETARPARGEGDRRRAGRARRSTCSSRRSSSRKDSLPARRPIGEP